MSLLSPLEPVLCNYINNSLMGGLCFILFGRLIAWMSLFTSVVEIIGLECCRAEL